MRPRDDESKGRMITPIVALSRKLPIGVASSLIFVATLLILAENWLAEIINDDLIATILLLIVGIIGLALIVPLFLRTRSR